MRALKNLYKKYIHILKGDMQTSMYMYVVDVFLWFAMKSTCSRKKKNMCIYATVHIILVFKLFYIRHHQLRSQVENPAKANNSFRRCRSKKLSTAWGFL